MGLRIMGGVLILLGLFLWFDLVMVIFLMTLIVKNTNHSLKPRAPGGDGW